MPLPKLYEMRIWHDEEPTDWYGPYAFTEEDVAEITLTDWSKQGVGFRKVEIRDHECDDLVNGGCGHMQEDLPAPY
jgi:hypothetical protein